MKTLVLLAAIMGVPLLSGCNDLNWPEHTGPLDARLQDFVIHDIYNVTWTFNFTNTGSKNIAVKDIRFHPGLWSENESNAGEPSRDILSDKCGPDCAGQFLAGETLLPGESRLSASRAYYGNPLSRMRPDMRYWNSLSRIRE